MGNCVGKARILHNALRISLGSKPLRRLLDNPARTRNLARPAKFLADPDGSASNSLCEPWHCCLIPLDHDHLIIYGDAECENRYEILLFYDGKAYTSWIPDSEAKFEELVNEHTQEIFGPSADYFNLKTKSRSETGIASIPDGYLITFEDQRARWYIVEIELSSHSVYEHVVTQASKFKTSLQNLENRKRLADILYDEIKSNPSRTQRLRHRLGDEEIYYFLNDLLSREPSLLIVIDSETKELEAAVNALRLDTDIVVFQTFVHGNSLVDHIHEFTPLYAPETSSVSPIPETDISEIAMGKITVTLGGRRVTIARDDILRAARNPRIKEFFYVGYYVELDGKKLPVKGLLSLATGIPVTEFGSTPKARGILQKLGLTVKAQDTPRIEGAHLMQTDFEREVLLILVDEQRPLTRKEIVQKLSVRMHQRFSEADRARTKSGAIRWEKNARWAVTNLKNAELVEAKERNRWTITAKGHEVLLTKYRGHFASA